jgi:peptidoglycan/xylan/chitin deacetylase (PgdA/CDA1 family)
VVEPVAAAIASSRLLRSGAWRGVLTLAYHRIHPGGEAQFDPGLLSATTEDFSEQLAFIAGNFDVVSPEAIQRDPGAPGRRVVITFDDGYRDNYELALPALRKHGLPAAFFLTTGFLDEPSLPWWDELAWMVDRSTTDEIPAGRWLPRPVPLGDRLRATADLTTHYKSLPTDRGQGFLEFCGEAAGVGRADAEIAAHLWMTWEMAAGIRDAGMTIGGHTVNHPVLARSSPEAQRREVFECLRRLEEELGERPAFFAYPVGLRSAFDDTTKRILREAGVDLAFSLYGGYLRPGRLDRLDVPRASVGIATMRTGFRAMLGAPGLFARW